jgi:hypothetical protein
MRSFYPKIFCWRIRRSSAWAPSERPAYDDEGDLFLEFSFLIVFGILSTVGRVSFVLLPNAPLATLKPTQGNQIGTEYSKVDQCITIINNTYKILKFTRSK